MEKEEELIWKHGLVGAEFGFFYTYEKNLDDTS